MKRAKIGVVIPTCDEERKVFLNFLLRRIAHQSRPADAVYVIDYPNEGGVDITDRFRVGLNKAILEGCDLIISMEDDDYYPLDYIEQVETLWESNGRPVLLGHKQTINYHIFDGTYRIVNRKDRASAFCTAMSQEVNFDVKEQIWDYAVWKKNKGVLVLLIPPPVGIKHGVGLTGGHTQSVCKRIDNDRTILRGFVDAEAFEFYTTLFYEKRRAI